ncbi:MAG: hypothetical protein OEU32_11910, partial [Acidimicrobiia bacterium]|nr:hypothetical protein [Acidimicrobiia bacterium]
MSTAPRLASIVFIVALATSGCAWIARASVDSAGNQAGGGDSVFAAVSGDGRYVAFSSDATNLVAGDTNGVRDVFLRDNATGVTSRVSVDSAANQAIGDGDGRGSYLPAISTNGRFVAFTSFAANLVLGDTNGWPDVFVHDTTTGATTRVSVDSAGIQGAGPSGAAWGTLEWMAADISGDGRYVSFTSAAGNLVADDTNAILDVFVHDTTAGVTTRVSVDSAGNQAACAGLDLTCLQTGSYGAAISDDGGHVAYQSWTINLVAGDTNAADDVFVHDTTTGTTTRVSVDSTGGQSVGGGGSQAMQAISADGTRVAFASSATNLVAGDTNTQPDIFVHDTTTGTTSR